MEEDKIYICIMKINQSEVLSVSPDEMGIDYEFDEWYHDENQGAYYRFCRNVEDACLATRAKAVKMTEVYIAITKSMDKKLIEMNEGQKDEAS